MEPESAGFWQLVNWVDLVLVLGLITGLLVGLGVGFYRQLAIGGSLIIGYLLASRLTGPLAETGAFEPIHAQFGSSGAHASAFSLILLGSLLLGLLSVLIFRSYFGRTLRFVDGLLGGVLGVALAGFLFGLSFLGICHWEETPLHGPIRDSLLGSRFAEGARVASRIFPQEYRHRVEAALEERLPSILAGEKLEPVGGKPRADDEEDL